MIVFLYFHFHGRSESWDLRKKQKFVKYLFQEKIIFRLSRHFRPKLVHWNKGVNCTPIDRALKMRFNKGLGSFLGPTIPEAWKFLESIMLFFRQNNYTNIRRFWTIFRHTTRVFSLQKSTKNTVFSTMTIQHIFDKS